MGVKEFFSSPKEWNTNRRKKKQDEKDAVRRKELESKEGRNPIQKQVLEKERKEQKKKQYIDLIAKEKGQPLEKLIQVVASKAGEQLTISDDTRTATDPSTMSKGEIVSGAIKQGFKNVGHGIKGKAADIFDSWKEKIKNLNTGSGWIEVIKDTGAGISGLAGLPGGGSDIAADVYDGKGKSKSKGGEKNGTVGAALGFISAIGDSISFACDMINEIKTLIKGESDNRDHQERWKAARGYMRDFVGILEGFTGAVGGVIKEIPIFGPILGICSGSVNLVLDVMDLVSNAVHVESMRKMRNEIYERIQQKRVKYSSGQHEDKAAAEAYTVDMGRFRRSRKVDKKRRSLLEKVYKIERDDDLAGPTGTSKKSETGATALRSRNDSKFRAAQYDLAKKIGEKRAAADATDEQKKKTKSEKRQMEALQMMEEFREADKAHKKMSKAVTHNVEDILAGGLAIGVDIVGLVGKLSGIGAGVGVAADISGYVLKGAGYVRQGAAAGYKALRVASGTEANKATTREDMAISLINKMEDIAASNTVWAGTSGFRNRAYLEDYVKEGSAGYKDIVKQGRNVDHLHKILRSGLDASMSDLISAKSKDDLKGKIADAFGQD